LRIEHLDEGVGRIIQGVNTTPDVGVDQTRIEAAKFGNKVDKDGRPPTLSSAVKGKSTNVLFNLGLTEGIKLRLERDKDIDVLHIMDTKGKQRIEVRGKKGYETGGYDAKDKLHQVLDRVGKAANISELMNGEVVGINPNHPQGTRAIRTARDVLQTESSRSVMEQAIIEGGHSLDDLDKPTPTIAELVKMHDVPAKQILKQLEMGIEAEYEHTSDFEVAKEIALDHIAEDPSYYDKLKFIENFADGKKKIQEALDNPYPFELIGPNDSQEFSALAQTPNGVLRMDFEATDYDNFGIDFSVGKSMGKTDAGDEFRTFATVVAMMTEWIKTVGIEHVESFDFGANKDEHASDGRAKLYTRFAKQLASKLGWRLEQSTTANRGTEFFKLTNPKPVPRDDEYWDALEENFADGKKKGKSRPGRVKKSGASCNGSVTDLRKRAKKYSGERGKMYHWCANMKSGKKKK